MSFAPLAEAPPDYEQQVVAAQEAMGDPKKVRAWLLKWMNENYVHAKAETQMFHQALQQAENDFKGDQYPASKEQSKQLGTPIQFEEHKNQVNIATATMIKNMKRSGRTYRYQAINGEVQSRADALQAVVDSQLEETGWERELCRFYLRLNKHDAVCMKLICDYRDVVEPRQRQIIMEEAPAYMAAMDAAGVPYSVISDGSDGEPVVFETPAVQGRMKIGAKCVDMRNLVFADPCKPDIQDQQYIGEDHFYTEDQLEDNAMFRIDWEHLGEPNAKDKRHTETNQPAAATGTIQTPRNFKQWRVTEGNCRIPWMRAKHKRIFNDADLLAFWVEERGGKFDEAQRMVSECAFPQKWIMHHLEDKQIFKLDPTYCPDKNAYPYRMSSFIDGDTELFGQSQMRQTLPMSNLMNTAIQDGIDNVRMRNSVNAFYDSQSDVTPDKFAEVREGKNKFVPVEFYGGRTPKDSIVFIPEVVPDTWPMAVSMYSLARSEARSFGVPDIMQANGSADTATQDTINNERGQAKLDYPFGLAIMDVVVPILKDIGLLCFKHFTEPRMIEIGGEAASGLGRYRKITRDMITNRFKVVPMATFDFINRQGKANSLLQALNIISRAPGDPLLMKWAAKFLEYMGEDRSTINEMTDNVGKGTSAEDEINVLCYQPLERMQDRIRPDDDPYERLLLIRRIMGIPELGIPPGDPEKAKCLNENPNFEEYVQKLLDLEQLMEMRRTGKIAPPPGEEPSGKGGSTIQPNPAPPSDEEGTTRAAAQKETAPDSGGNTTGATGRAMIGGPA